MIEKLSWQNIEFFNIDRSTFVEDYGIKRLPSVMIIDKNCRITYKRDFFNQKEPWFEHIDSLIQGKQPNF